MRQQKLPARASLRSRAAAWATALTLRPITTVTHRGITTRLSQATGLPVFACDYRLAPRHQFPSAADDVRAAYEWLLAEGHDPDRIVIAGDSAGGHLAVDLALQLLREGARPPAALALFSPLFDPTFELAAKRERRRRDPMISADAEELARSLAAGGGHCVLEVWPGQMHVFQALPRFIPEADAAIARAADFVVTELMATKRRSSFTLVEEA